jgi:hypothetical protein
MSGAVAAHAAYNGSGTQGLAVTNKIQDQEGDVMSVFWNKNDTTRQLLHGSTILEVPASGGSGNSSNWGSTQIFDINNDIDCLGDMYLEVQIETNADPSASDDTIFNAQQIAEAINRVEFQVGTQIWQTLEYQDIMGLASTEMSEGAYREFSNQTSGRYTSNGKPMNNAQFIAATPSAPLKFKDNDPIAADSARIAYIPLKMFTKSINPELQHFSEKSEGGYLMAAAPNQQVKIKVYTAAAFSPVSGVSADLNIRLFAKNIVMCNEEREQMKAMPLGIPKRIKTTQNANTNIANHQGGAQVQLLDIDHFSLYASHLLITFPKIFYSNILNVELLLNSSSFSGELPVSLLEIISSSMNLYNNNYIVNGEDADRFDTIVFPLASRAYSGSSVPLNRFDNIRLKIRHTATITSSASGQFNITCVGETTALYKGGAASLAMY